MGNTNRRRGHDFERELVNIAEEEGFQTQRAYNSQGSSLGEVEECDVKIDGWRIDCKRRKSIAQYLSIPEGVEVKAIREDYGDPLVLMSFDQFLELIDEDSNSNSEEKLNKIRDILDETAKSRRDR